MLEIEEGNYDAIVRDSIRRRLARTIVHLGVMIDPTANDSKDED